MKTTIDLGKIIEDFLENSTDEELLAELETPENRVLARRRSHLWPKTVAFEFSVQQEPTHITMMPIYLISVLPRQNHSCGCDEEYDSLPAAA